MGEKMSSRIYESIVKDRKKILEEAPDYLNPESVERLVDTLDHLPRRWGSRSAHIVYNPETGNLIHLSAPRGVTDSMFLEGDRRSIPDRNKTY